MLHTLDSFASHLKARDLLNEKRRQRELAAKLRAEREHAEQQRKNNEQRRLRLRTQARTSSQSQPALTRNPLSLQTGLDLDDEDGGMAADDLVEVVFGSDVDGFGAPPSRWCGGRRGHGGRRFGCARALIGWLGYACNIAGAWVCGCGGIRSESGAIKRY